MLKRTLIAAADGRSPAENRVEGDGFRITVITPQLFRVEVSRTGMFEDRPTQSVWFRDAGSVPFTKNETSRVLTIATDKVRLRFDKYRRKPVDVVFSQTGRRARCNNANALPGTRRTLDQTWGPVKLGKGMVASDGVAVMEDSRSLLLGTNGQILPREHNETDVYIFAHGTEYRQAMRDFYTITGAVPLVPRFALGVWWSRYKAYTQEEYLGLMQRFEDEEIPLTVATVDMDWHWTNLNAQFGTNYKPRPLMDRPCTGGWTGYSWNTDLFPDYRAFLAALKEKNLAVTLNLHPADGVRFFESMYVTMAAANGIDPATKKPVEFRAGDARFWNSYFDVIHKPYERDGVDFWWIDWQQGNRCEVPGLDPLWALNHYHYLDNAEDGRQPLILSRYAGAGSHRYPLGFSGDTAMNWRVLRFQPYFTATAANAGYTWWSHDIGGHHFGRRDDELYLRWIQFGVVSPILRLHSTASDLLGKEPWLYPAPAREIAARWLRLRHALIPYIYTMNHRTHTRGIALCEPLYYEYPDNPAAYKVKNEYLFGSELLVLPVTHKVSKSINLARENAWIPPGRWTDVFTGEIYENEGSRELYRDIASIPVLARAGAIIPLSADDGNRCESPAHLVLWVFRGNGEFVLCEDDGCRSGAEHCAQTRFNIVEENHLIFTLTPPPEHADCCPQKRTISVVFRDIKSIKTCAVFADESPRDLQAEHREFFGIKAPAITLKNLPISSTLRIEITGYEPLKNPPEKEQIVALFSRWQAGNLRKQILYRSIKNETDPRRLKNKIRRRRLPLRVKSALLSVFIDRKDES